MGYHFFGKRNRRTAGDGNSEATTEFAATEATLPPAAQDSVPPELDIDIQDDPSPSGVMDSQVMDSQVMDSQVMDSQIMDSQVMDSGVPTGAPRDPQLPAKEAGRSSAEKEADTLTKSQPTLSHVGRYALKSHLGQGGLGQVHEAWDPLLSRTVAVKTLQFDLPTPLRVSLDGMILNEARAAASLNHAYIVTVFDAGLSAHGVYIAMERLQGRDMRHALANGWSPSPRVAATLVRRVADALAYAHARGVVHCDIKPGNIFLVGRDRPKVLDFGIARIAHAKAVPALAGAVAGSPHYQAPEQIRGEAVDARTDLYALGTVLYELLTGRKAFAGDSVEQIQTAVQTLHPAPAHEVRPGVPQALSDIAAKAMARDPAERFTSAIEMSMSLRRWAEARAAKAPSATAKSVPTATVKARDTRVAARRRPLLLLGGLLAAAGLGMVLARRPATDTGVEGSALPPGDPATPPTLASTAPAATAAEPANATNATNTSPADAASAAAESTAVAETKPAAKPPATPAAKPRPPAPKAGPSNPAAKPAAPLSTGTVQLAISPWGRVEVDGSPAGTTPPLTRLTLSEGAHTITVRNEDFPPFVQTVQVSADKPATLRHRFGP